RLSPAAQQPLGMRARDVALGQRAEGSRPEAGDEARGTDLPREGREPVREGRARVVPVADRALPAVVDLHDLDRERLARGGERLEVAPDVRLADAVEEVVPVAPARDEGMGGASAGEAPVGLGVSLEQLARIRAEGDPQRVELALLARREDGAEPE